MGGRTGHYKWNRGLAPLLKNGRAGCVSPPPLVVSSNWGLSGIDLIGPASGWAVGSDVSNLTGVLLKYAAPRISVSPTSIDFKKVEIEAFLEKTVTVRNTGNETLPSTAVTSPSPPFSISTDSCSNQSLAPSRSLQNNLRISANFCGIL